MLEFDKLSSKAQTFEGLINLLAPKSLSKFKVERLKVRYKGGLIVIKRESMTS